MLVKKGDKQHNLEWFYNITADIPEITPNMNVLHMSVFESVAGNPNMSLNAHYN